MDTNGSLQSILLRFKYMPYPHDSVTLCKFIGKALTDYGITEKTVSITTDSASNNILAISQMMSNVDLNKSNKFGFFHMRCFAHILHNSLKDALTRINPALETLRSIIKDLKKSTKKTECFMKMQLELLNHDESDNLVFASPLKLLNEVQTRWNSTYTMLERALVLQEAISGAIYDFDDFRHYEEPDWEKISKLIRLLKPIEELTRRLSSENVPSLSLLRVFVPKIISHLGTDFRDADVNGVALGIKTELNEYRKHTENEVVELATVLDPRFKLISHPLDHYEEVIRKLQERLDQYDGPELNPSDSTESFFSDCFITTASSSETERYFAAPRANAKCNPLDYWNLNKNEYPKMTRLARKILAIQATSVDSERVLSRSGLIDTDRRGRLSVQSFESSVQMRSWLLYLDIRT